MLENRWLSVHEAKQILNCSQSYVRYLIRTEVLRGQKIGPRAWVVDIATVEEFKQKPKKTGRPIGSKENN